MVKRGALVRPIMMCCLVVGNELPVFDFVPGDYAESKPLGKR